MIGDLNGALERHAAHLEVPADASGAAGTAFSFAFNFLSALAHLMRRGSLRDAALGSHPELVGIGLEAVAHREPDAVLRRVSSSAALSRTRLPLATAAPVPFLPRSLKRLTLSGPSSGSQRSPNPSLSTSRWSGLASRGSCRGSRRHRPRRCRAGRCRPCTHRPGSCPGRRTPGLVRTSCRSARTDTRPSSSLPRRPGRGRTARRDRSRRHRTAR